MTLNGVVVLAFLEVIYCHSFLVGILVVFSLMLLGHAMWPAVVIDEAYVGANRVLKTMQGERAVSVQFFGTHDFARFNIF